VQWRIVRPTCGPIMLWLAPLYRAWLRHVVFIGVTGSCGKMTTKELIAAILSQANSRAVKTTTATIYRLISPKRFYASDHGTNSVSWRLPLQCEATESPSRPIRLVKPQTGVVTNIGQITSAHFAPQRQSLLRRASRSRHYRCMAQLS
jgi:UDP-N-acetylmuramate-alanine ligase